MSVDERAPETAAEPTTVESLLAAFAALNCRLDAQQVQLHEQAERLAQQEGELQTLRAVAAQALAEAAQQATPIAEQSLVLPEPMVQARATRRSVITRTAAALAALGLAGTAGPRGVQAQTPPGTRAGSGTSATGGNVIIGQVNNTTAVGDTTWLQNNSASIAQRVLFRADLYGTGVGPTTAPANTKISILGGNTYDASDAAVAGNTMYGVYGKVTNGVGIGADGLWPLRIAPSVAGADLPSANSAGTAPPFGVLFHQRGTMHGIGVSATFDPDTLWLNFSPSLAAVVANATFWRRIAYQGSAGVFVPVTPVRVLNTGFAVAAPIGFDQTGAALTTNFQLNVAPNTDETRQFRLAGQFGLPIDIRGVVGNVTVVQNVASGGFVSIFAGGAAAPAVSTVNPSTPIQANSFFAQIGQSGAGDGNISVRAVGDQAKNIIIDIFGYYF